MRGWIIGLTVGGLALAGLVIAGLAEAQPLAGTTSTLTPGHRFGLAVQCPFPIPALPSDPAAVAALLGITGVTVANYSPAADGKTFAVVFDYAGPSMLLPPIQAGGGSACKSELVDMGLSP